MPAVMGVAIGPGWIDITRMPNGPSSSAALLVRPRTPHLEAVEAPIDACPINPAVEEIVMIAPPLAFFKDATVACMPSHVPVRCCR